MSEQHDTIEQLCVDVAIATAYMGRYEDEKWKHDAWTVVLVYQGRTYDGIAYRMGTGHSKPYPGANLPFPSKQIQTEQKRWKPTPPTTADVVNSLLGDVEGLDQPFESWAADLGMDEDSRKAERTYHVCLATLPRLRALFGADFRRFEQADRL